MQAFTRGLLPDLHEDALQRIDFIAFYAAVHIAPRPHLLSAVDIVVRNIHAASVGDFPIDDDDLAMVAAEDVVDPREAQRVEFVDLYAFATQFAEVTFAQGLVVGGVAECVEQGSYLHTLGGFFRQEFEEQHRDRVVAEVEVFQMDAAASLADGLKHIIELLLTAGE